MLWTADSVEYRSVPMYAAYSGDTLIWLKESQTDPLTIEVLTGGTIIMDFSGTTAEMRINDGSFEPIGNQTYNVRTGDILQFRGSDTTYYYKKDGYYIGHGVRGGTAKFNVYGNIMSMIYPNSFDGRTIPSDSIRTFESFFSSCSGLKSASGLILPSNTTINCYNNFFRDCTNLTGAPYLPAKTLSDECYYAMFRGCTSMITPPVLPATKLATNCYASMFSLCSGLITAPTLPVIDLEEDCYYGMFHDCTGLVNAPALPATNLKHGCYGYMFENCVSLTTAPDLPAKTGAAQAYDRMFKGCTSLSYIKCLLTSNWNDVTIGWVSGVPSSGTFVKDPSMNDWTTGVSGIPSGWTVIDNN